MSISVIAAHLGCRGQISSLKMSPNLRRYSVGDNRSAIEAAELQKLGAVLQVAQKQAQELQKALSS